VGPRTQTLTKTVLLVTALIGGLAGSDLPLGAHRIALGLGALLLAAIFIVFRPREALLCSVFLFLWGTTKFRDRDASALLEGDLDVQVFLELAVSALLAWIVVANVAAGVQSRRFVNGLAPLEIALLAYVLLALLSGAWSVNPSITLVRGVQLLILWALSVVAVRMLGPGEMVRLLRLSVVPYVLLAAATFVVFPPAAWFNQGRFTWFNMHPIAAGTFLGTAAVLILVEVLNTGNASAPLIRVHWITIALLMRLLLATRSRGPIFAFAIAALAVCVRRYLPPRAAGVVVCVLVAAGVLALRAAVSAHTTFQGPLGSLMDYLLRGETEDQFLGLSGRLDLWQYVGVLVRQRPILGYGYLASRSILLQRFPWAGEAHGALAESLLSFGVVGSAVLWGSFLALLCSAFFRTFPLGGAARRSHEATVGLLMFLLVESIDGQGIAGIPGYEVLVLFLCSAVYGSLVAARSQNAAPPRQRSWQPAPAG
jgi:O-antigen ligase